MAFQKLPVSIGTTINPLLTTVIYPQVATVVSQKSGTMRWTSLNKVFPELIRDPTHLIHFSHADVHADSRTQTAEHRQNLSGRASATN